MEPNNGGLEDYCPFQVGDFLSSNVNVQGCTTLSRFAILEKSCDVASHESHHFSDLSLSIFQ